MFPGLRLRPHFDLSRRLTVDWSSQLFATYFSDLSDVVGRRYWVVYGEAGALLAEVESAYDKPSQWWSEHTVPMAGTPWDVFEEARPAGEPDQCWALFRPSLTDHWLDLVNENAGFLFFGFKVDAEFQAVSGAKKLIGVLEPLLRQPTDQGRDTLTGLLQERVDILLVGCDPGWEIMARDPSLIQSIQVSSRRLVETTVEPLDLASSMLWQYPT